MLIQVLSSLYQACRLSASTNLNWDVSVGLGCKKKVSSSGLFFILNCCTSTWGEKKISLNVISDFIPAWHTWKTRQNWSFAPLFPTPEMNSVAIVPWTQGCNHAPHAHRHGALCSVSLCDDFFVPAQLFFLFFCISFSRSCLTSLIKQLCIFFSVCLLYDVKSWLLVCFVCSCRHARVFCLCRSTG